MKKTPLFKKRWEIAALLITQNTPGLSYPQSYNQAEIRGEKQVKLQIKVIPAKFDVLVHWDSLWQMCYFWILV